MQLNSIIETFFKNEFEPWLTSSLLAQKYADWSSPRFLRRSILPHFEGLLKTFNDRTAGSGLNNYWSKTSHKENLRLTYLLGFLPTNAARMAAVLSELTDLGFDWTDWAAKRTEIRALEWGAGPSTACIASAIASPLLGTLAQKQITWASIEQDRQMLQSGVELAQSLFDLKNLPWSIAPYHRKLADQLLPENAPKFDLCFMSFFLNESSETPIELAKKLDKTAKKHLTSGGLLIIVEPALRLESRRILEIRKALIDQKSVLQVLTPCLGHQTCGALEDPQDWCHEEIDWWRPTYLRQLEQMADVDRKKLPFTYLVLSHSNMPVQQVLPKVTPPCARLVSPTHSEGPDWEFFTCSKEGKKRCRIKKEKIPELNRGDILSNITLRGTVESTRLDSAKKIQK